MPIGSDHDGLYARDDGSRVPFHECTREELLNTILGMRQTISTLRQLTEHLKRDHGRTRQQALDEAAAAILKLK